MFIYLPIPGGLKPPLRAQKNQAYGNQSVRGSNDDSRRGVSYAEDWGKAQLSTRRSVI
jgi:hypothetical protein